MVDYKIVIKKTITKHRESAVDAQELLIEIINEINQELLTKDVEEYFDVEVFEQQTKPAWVKRKVEVIADDA